MVNTELLDYVKQQLAQGSNKDKIIHDLSVAGGWTLADIIEAFSALGISQSVPVNPANPSPISSVSSASIANPLSPASPVVVSTEALAATIPKPTVPTQTTLAPATQTPTTGTPFTPPAAVSAPATVKYAGFWIRWVAFMVDSLILFIPIGAVQFLSSFVLAGAGVSLTGENLAMSVIYMLIVWIYFSWMTFAKGATLGKMFVGITVKSEDMGNLSFGRILLRETIGKIISGFIVMIGYIMAGFTQKKQALHDKFAHSVVVYTDHISSKIAGSQN